MSLEVRSVSMSYGKAIALKNCSLSVAVGELIAIVGPSGCGKTTLLRIIAGLLEADSGEVWLNDKRLDHRRPRDRHVAFVMQHLALYPHLTAGDNIKYPLRVRGVPESEADVRVRMVAELVGISALLGRFPSQMSGGQKQRVAVARALVRDDAQLLLADEPFSDLDAQLRYQFRPEFKRLQRDRALPCLFVTHDQEEALAIGDRVAVMNEGGIVQLGYPYDLYHRPVNTFVARFIGRPPMNLLTAELAKGVLRGSSFGVADAAPDVGETAEGSVWVGVRPEEIQLCGDDVRARSGQIDLVESTGPDSLVYVIVGSERMVVRHAGQVIARPGDPCKVAFPSVMTRVFDRTSGSRLEGNATPR